MLKIEQLRITGELRSAQERINAIDVGFDFVKVNLSKSIEFASNWKGAYISASPNIRRQLNQAIFKRIYVDDSGYLSSELNEPFEVLLSDEVTLTSELRAFSKLKTSEVKIDDFWTDLLSGRRKTAEIFKINPNSSLNNLDFTLLCKGLKDDLLVGEGGLEPPQSCLHRNLNPARLPIPPLARTIKYFSLKFKYCKKVFFWTLWQSFAI